MKFDESQQARAKADDKAGSTAEKVRPSTILLFGRSVPKAAVVEFKRLYTAAIAANATEFEYHGQPVLVDFAKYVVEYAEYHFGETL